MSDSFAHLSQPVVGSIIEAASNPFIGLFIGLLVTALIQSSSTSTTLIVAAVASGSIDFHNAVPMIMGANIGTTITSTIVALGFIGKKNVFNKAISAAVVHDYFNILVVLLLFPLELKYGLLSEAAENISRALIGNTSITGTNQFRLQLLDLSPFTEVFTSLSKITFVNLLISFILLFSAIKILAREVSQLLIGGSEDKLQRYIFTNTGMSFLWGTLITGLIQSSSISTSLVVPFVATGKISLKRIAPFIMGANVGTTITAFIAVFFRSYELVSIAMVHLIFNMVGVIIFLPFPFTRHLIVRLAEKFGELAANFRIAVLIYILMIFFVIPFCLIYFTQALSEA